MSKSNAQSVGTQELMAVEPSHKPTGEPSTWVRQDRKLALAYYTMSINEMRLIWELASRIRPTDNAFTEYEFTLSQLREIFGEHMSFADAEATLLRLYRRELHAETETGAREALRWVISAIRDEARQTFKIALHPKLRSYFIGLQQWVQTEKATLCAFSSEYAARLYLMACVHRNQKIQSWEVSIVELRARLGISAEQYQRFSNLRARVLDAPVKEINEKAAPFKLSFSIRKRSYTPVAVVFDLEDWARTTTGTGETIKRKIAKARRKKAAPTSEQQPPLLLATDEQRQAKRPQWDALKQVVAAATVS